MLRAFRRIADDRLPSGSSSVAAPAQRRCRSCRKHRPSRSEYAEQKPVTARRIVDLPASLGRRSRENRCRHPWQLDDSRNGADAFRGTWAHELHGRPPTAGAPVAHPRPQAQKLSGTSGASRPTSPRLAQKLRWKPCFSSLQGIVRKRRRLSPSCASALGLPTGRRGSSRRKGRSTSNGRTNAGIDFLQPGVYPDASSATARSCSVPPVGRIRPGAEPRADAARAHPDVPSVEA